MPEPLNFCLTKLRNAMQVFCLSETEVRFHREMKKNVSGQCFFTRGEKKCQ